MKIKYFFFLILFIAACKGESNDEQSNVVNVRIEGEPQLLNPIRSTVAYNKQVEWQIFMPLLQFDATTLDLYPVLVSTRPKVKTITEGALQGGRKYTFDLREEAKWDDGRAVTAADFIFTLKALFHPGIGSPGFRAFLSFIEKVEVDTENDRQFSVYTNRAFNLTEAVIGTMAIYPAHIYDEQEVLQKYPLEVFLDPAKSTEVLEKDSLVMTFGKQFVQFGGPNDFNKINGCGPYKIEEWLVGQRIVLKKKENWWAAGLPKEHQSFGNYPEQIIYQFVEDNAAVSALLREQKIDVAAAIDPIIFNELKKENTIQQAFNLYTPMASAYYFISFNTKKQKLAMPEVRRAISHLVDVEEMIKVAMNGYAVRTTGPILPSKAYYQKDLEPIAFDVEKARTLLNESGWKDENQDGVLEKMIDGEQQDCILSYKYTSNNPVAEKIGLLLKNNAAKAGVEIELFPLENRKLIEDTRSRDFDLYFSQWSQMPGLDDLRSIWHTTNDRPRGFNKTGFGNAETDALIEAINVELDETKRNKLYEKIQQIIYDEQPYIFLFVPTERILVNKKISTEVSTMRPGYFENMFDLRQ